MAWTTGSVRPFRRSKRVEFLNIGDVTRAMLDFYVITQVRRNRRKYSWTTTDLPADESSMEMTDTQAKQMSGHLPDRFVLIDTLQVDVVTLAVQITGTWKGSDITSLSIADYFNEVKAGADRPHELQFCSFGDGDLLKLKATAVGGAAAVDVYIYTEEYRVKKLDKRPRRYRIATYYGVSRVVTAEEDAELDLAGILAQA